MKIRPPIIRAWTGDPVYVDLYAGGGGASDGKRRATGRSPNIAINHWDAAIAMHKVNHPDCEHYCEDVYAVHPLDALKGRPCRGLWASPTCVHFSRASGRRLSPETIKIRGLAWSIMPWIVNARPDWIIVENVVEFLKWGPVSWQHIDGCTGLDDKSGKSCVKACPYGRPIKSREGELFRAWESRIRSYGYSFEVRVIKAWKFGSPTMRERVYIAMRADGQAFDWPSETHAEPEHAERTGKKPWRTAAEIIDWSIPCPSIFERKKPHVTATRRRLAKGMRKFVLETAKPFLMHLTHGDRHAPHSLDQPTPTVTGANRGEQALVVPFAIHRSNGERPGQEPRTYDVLEPVRTVVAGGIKTAPVVAFLAKAYGERHETEVQASGMDKPIGATTAQDHHHLVAAHTVKFYGTSTGANLNEPTHTVTANDRGGGHLGIVATSLMRYNGQSIGQAPDEPIGTLDSRDRYAVNAAFMTRYNGERRDGEGARGVALDQPVSTLDASNRLGLVEAAAAEWNDIIAAKAHRVYDFLIGERCDGPWMDHENRLVRLPGTELVIYDIGMRMLVVRELFRANGFHDSYIIELAGPDGEPLTKTELTRLAGNVVCPDVAEALVRAAEAGPRNDRPSPPRAPQGQLSLALEAA